MSFLIIRRDHCETSNISFSDLQNSIFGNSRVEFADIKLHGNFYRIWVSEFCGEGKVFNPAVSSILQQDVYSSAIVSRTKYDSKHNKIYDSDLTPEDLYILDSEIRKL